MRKINVCIIGAGGTMGYKTSRNLLRKQDKYELSVCEIDPDAIGKLEKIGLHVTDMDAAVPNADVVVPAINDSGLKALAPKVLACMKPGAAMVILDPASVINGEIPQRNDCTLAICHPCHPSFFLDQDTPEARADKYGCNGGKQDIVMHLEDRVGYIKPGYNADLVFLNENPFEKLETVCAVAGVIHDGQVICGLS